MLNTVECPRPLIVSLESADIPITFETLGNVTGCYERCMIGIRNTPGAHVPPELNQMVKEQFSDYISNFISCKDILTEGDVTSVADFGTFMDGYEE